MCCCNLCVDCQQAITHKISWFEIITLFSRPGTKQMTLFLPLGISMAYVPLKEPYILLYQCTLCLHFLFRIQQYNFISATAARTTKIITQVSLFKKHTTNFNLSHECKATINDFTYYSIQIIMAIKVLCLRDSTATSQEKNTFCERAFSRCIHIY